MADQAPKVPTRLIVVLAFARDDEGNLQPAFEPREVQSEDKAKQDARVLAASGVYAGVIAWSRTVDLVNGEFGSPAVLHQWGEIPDME